MGLLSIREFNANVSKVFARVERGETIEITRNGKVIAELSPKRHKRHDPEWQKKVDALMELLDDGILLGGPAAYDERTS